MSAPTRIRNDRVPISKNAPTGNQEPEVCQILYLRLLEPGASQLSVVAAHGKMNRVSQKLKAFAACYNLSFARRIYPAGAPAGVSECSRGAYGIRYEILRLRPHG
ncbi:hypothetical protein SODG_004830 [Sodalis praecaptivus]